jgi:integrase
LLGLRWSDFGWQKATLAIQRQLQRVTGKGLIFTEPKSKAGTRNVIIGSNVVIKLNDHLKSQQVERLFAGERWKDSDLIFSTSIGTPVDPRNLLRDFKRQLKKANLPEIRFHDLRHTSASLMLQEGIHPKIVQERLGHSKISITLDTYSHVLPGIQEEAAQRLDELIVGIPVEFS